MSSRRWNLRRVGATVAILMGLGMFGVVLAIATDGRDDRNANAPSTTSTTARLRPAPLPEFTVKMRPLNRNRGETGTITVRRAPNRPAQGDEPARKGMLSVRAKLDVESTRYALWLYSGEGRIVQLVDAYPGTADVQLEISGRRMLRYHYLQVFVVRRGRAGRERIVPVLRARTDDVFDGLLKAGG